MGNLPIPSLERPSFTHEKGLGYRENDDVITTSGRMLYKFLPVAKVFAHSLTSGSLLPSHHPLLATCAVRAKMTGDKSGPPVPVGKNSVSSISVLMTHSHPWWVTTK